VRVQLKFKKISWHLYAGVFVVSILSYTLAQFFPGSQGDGVVVNNTELIQSGVETDKVEASGGIEIASQFNGKVISVPVVEGQTIQAGQTLVILENSEDRAALTRAHADVTKAVAKLRQVKEMTLSFSEQSLVRAQATHQNAKKQYDRTRELSAKGYVSQTQLDDALRNLAIAHTQVETANFQARSIREKNTDYKKAESAVSRARENERQAQARLANVQITAEAGGIIKTINVVKGNEVVVGKPLMVITTASKMPLTVKIDEKYQRI
jgi:HlyD family secretion protein